MPLPSRRATGALFGAALALLVSPLVRANNLVGAWDPQVYSWPLIPVHSVLMPDNRILTYGTDGIARQTGFFIYDIWDINSGLNGGHLTLDNVTNTDIFCGSQVVLPGGSQVFLAGGDNWTGTSTTNTGNNNSNLFTLSSNVLARGNNMNRARWYSGSTMLLNGEVYIQGGSSGTDRPEVRQSNGTFRLLSNTDTSTLDFMYPRNWIAPDGRVFGYDSNGKMYYINPAGTGTITNVGQFASQYRASDASAAMFRPGRILQFGGNSNGAIVIDVTGAGTPVVTPTQSMSTQRRLVTAAVLPDGKVLATGGSQVNNELTGVNNSAEIWDPTTGTWRRGPDGQRPRLYHSMSLLLPDARVLVGGGGAPGPVANMNMEVYLPPYLYDSTGARAMQPRLTSAPAAIDIGETFFVDYTDAASISRVTMVKTASVTHGWNMEQRFVELTFIRDGNRLRIQAPTKAADAPPGFWMLFAFNENGVPSTARILKVNIAANWNPAITPVLTNPGNRTNQVGQAVNLQLAATDPNNDELGYGASGLPPGLSINTTTGAITGTPTASGNFNVVVAASDGVNTDSESFVWTITDPSPLQVTLPPTPPGPMLSGATATFSVTVTNGLNARVRWDFDDGTPVTAYSSSTSITHTFTHPGVFYVTVTAIDDRGVPVSQTFVQIVHLPLTANRPNASSNIAYETRAGGNRVWVVNQDNDTASVFNAVTNAKVGEVAVGTAPRTVAIAPDGRIWVTNKLSASISVIDPTSLSVVSTVPLPRASQPFGIVFDPAGSAAFVTLEATGAVVKLNPSSGAVLGTVNVGANPRHLSVNESSQSLYVSRFITPPIPGESTATPQTNLGAAEVVQLTSSPFAIVRTITLAHSNLPDFETQGRGIPNYLGAAVISPDGTQAWVPSKQDNIARGTLRDGNNIDFQNTVRAISSRIDLAAGTETPNARIDLDNAGLASAVAYDPLGVYMFVALETSREIAVVDAHGRWEIFRFDAGRAPQGLVVAPDGSKLFVNNFMDRTVQIFDLQQLRTTGATSVPVLATVNSVATEKLTANVLKGKQFFYDARDTRLARDRYMSCASCHNDGGSDGRVWDLTGMGEGLRNTITLNGRAGMAHGFLHWSANFDEVQDFEGQIRALAGGTGLMTDAAFATRNTPLGAAKAGVSADLDALASYLESLTTFNQSPYRNSDGTLTTLAAQGRTVFQNNGCGSCHAGTSFTSSSVATLLDVGTIKQPGSGKRLGATLTGIDPPTLRDVWATAPYLHDGSAATLADAVRAHTSITLSASDVNAVVAYLTQIGNEEATAPVITPTTVIRVNAGGPQYTDTAGQVWAADFGYNTGSVVNVSNPISGTADPDLYRTERWDPPTGAELAYAFTVPNGTYTVKLYFAETWNGGQSVGSRIFNVALEGSQVLSNFDIFAQVGGYAALVKTFTTTVSDGQLNINFSHGSADDPQVGAIEILSTTGGPPPPADTQPPSVPQSLNGSASNSSQVQLSWAASTDTGGGSVAGYRIFRNGASIGTAPGTTYTDNTVAANTTYTYRVAAYDNASPANESAQSNQISVTTPVAPATVIRVNAGGPQYTDTAGQVWAADTGFNTGSTVNVSNAIAGTSDPALYRTERWDPGTAPELGYAFTVPNGTYTVKLHFAETWSGGQAVGKRVFNVALEGSQVLTNFDIFAQAGGYTALIKTFTATVNDGQLNINFTHGSADDPQVGAIEILSTGAPPPNDTQAPTVPQNLAGQAPSGSQVTLNWTASTDNGGGSVAGYRIYRNGSALTTTTGTTFADNTVAANTTYTYRVTAFDNASPANESAQSNQVSVTTPAQAATVIRVNAGGPQYTDSAGQVWAADFGFTGGSVTTVSNQIFGTSDPALVQRERWDSAPAPEMSYAFNVPNGNYTVKLHFAETWSGGQAVGRRIFDVLVENQLKLDNLDIFAEAGGYTLLVKTLQTTVTDGVLNINFVHGSADDPIIGAIEILSN